MACRKIKSLSVNSILLGLFLLPAVGRALDLTIEPRLQTGIIDYQFEQKPVSVSNEKTGKFAKDHGFKLVSALSFVGGGATLFLDRFFVDLYVQKAFSGSDTASQLYDFNLSFPSGDETVGLEGSYPYIIDSDFEREEYSFSTGYALGSQWVVFGGYRKAKTNFSDTMSLKTEIKGSVDSLEFPLAITAQGKRRTSFKQDGYFIGGVYAFNIGNHVIISLNAAVAFLDGKYDSRGSLETDATATVDGEQIDVPVPSSNIGTNHDGDTTGLSLGAALKGRIGERLGYALSVDGYSYDFEANQEYIADLSESVLRFSAGLSYQF
jgi:hypothetical protein